MTDTRKPDRTLRPDETFCPWCAEYFLNGDLFEAHRPKGACLDPEKLDLVLDYKGAWGFRGRGSAPTTVRPRRTNAQAAFDRIISRLPVKYRGDAKMGDDIIKVTRALERERDFNK